MIAVSSSRTCAACRCEKPGKTGANCDS
jgi:hypothetical protein